MAEGRLRPSIPTTHADEAEHRRVIAARANAAMTKDGTVGMVAPFLLQKVAVADLPDASLWEGALVHITDEAGGAIPAFSDGASWRRVTDRAIVS